MESCWCVEQDEYRQWDDCSKHFECYILICTECKRRYPDCEDSEQ